MSNAHIFNKENSLTYNFQRFDYLASTKEFKEKLKNFLLKDLRSCLQTCLLFSLCEIKNFPRVFDAVMYFPR